MNFLRPSVFNLQTADWNLKFQSVKTKRVLEETYKHFLDNFPSNFRKKLQFPKQKAHLSAFTSFNS